MKIKISVYNKICSYVFSFETRNNIIRCVHKCVRLNSAFVIVSRKREIQRHRGGEKETWAEMRSDKGRDKSRQRQ